MFKCYWVIDQPVLTQSFRGLSGASPVCQLMEASLLKPPEHVSAVCLEEVVWLD